MGLAATPPAATRSDCPNGDSFFARLLAVCGVPCEQQQNRVDAPCTSGYSLCAAISLATASCEQDSQGLRDVDVTSGPIYRAIQAELVASDLQREQLRVALAQQAATKRQLQHVTEQLQTSATTCEAVTHKMRTAEQQLQSAQQLHQQLYTSNTTLAGQVQQLQGQLHHAFALAARIGSSKRDLQAQLTAVQKELDRAQAHIHAPSAAAVPKPQRQPQPQLEPQPQPAPRSQRGCMAIPVPVPAPALQAAPMPKAMPIPVPVPEPAAQPTPAPQAIPIPIPIPVATIIPQPEPRPEPFPQGSQAPLLVAEWQAATDPHRFNDVPACVPRVPTTAVTTVRTLGEGGNGKVAQAVVTLPNGTTIRAALKTIKGDDQQSRHDMVCYEAAQTWRASGHPNTCSLLGITVNVRRGMAHGLLLELAPCSTSLYSFLAAPSTSGHTTPNMQEVLHLGLQAARGVAHAHQRSLYHCDIKPANFLVVRSAAAAHQAATSQPPAQAPVQVAAPVPGKKKARKSKKQEQEEAEVAALLAALGEAPPTHKGATAVVGRGPKKSKKHCKKQGPKARATAAAPPSQESPPAAGCPAVTSAVKVKLIDFGNSILLEGRDAVALDESPPAGTLNFVAPEQGRRYYSSPLLWGGMADVGFKADVYSLGAVLWSLLHAGRGPHDAMSAAEIEHYHRGHMPMPPPFEEGEEQAGLAEATMPADWHALVSACLAADPTQRPIAQDVVGQLERMLQQQVQQGSA